MLDQLFDTRHTVRLFLDDPVSDEHSRSSSTNRFPLFEKFVGDYTNKKIFDYGGNRGNLLHFSQSKILQQNYTCIDVEEDAIALGKQEFPDATSIHYNKFSLMYNNGNLNEPFPVFTDEFEFCI